MTWESLHIIADNAPATLTKSRPIKFALYLASLLVIGNWRQTVHSIKSPFRDRRITPIPSACQLDDSSIKTIHGAAPLPLSSFAVNLATKSAKA